MRVSRSPQQPVSGASLEGSQAELAQVEQSMAKSDGLGTRSSVAPQEAQALDDKRTAGGRYLPRWGVARMTRIAGRALPPLLALLVIVLAWEFACWILRVPEYLVPRPTRVAEIVWANLGLLVSDSLVTLAEAALGFVAAFACAAVVGLVFAQFRLAERCFMPYLVAFQSVPIIAMAPLLVLWFGNGLAGKVVMAAIICFFPAVVSISRGLRSVSPDALTLMHSLSATRLQILFKLRVPSAMPFVFAAMRVSATLGVIGALVAEISGAQRGIGFRIVVSTYRTDTTMLFAALVFSAILGISFYAAMAALERIIRWYRPVGHVT